MQWTTTTNFAIWHTVKNSSGKQQHCSCSESIVTQGSAAEIHGRYILIHTWYTRTAVYSIIIIYHIDQVQVCSVVKPHTTMPNEKR